MRLVRERQNRQKQPSAGFITFTGRCRRLHGRAPLNMRGGHGWALSSTSPAQRRRKEDIPQHAPVNWRVTHVTSFNDAIRAKHAQNRPPEIGPPSHSSSFVCLNAPPIISLLPIAMSSSAFSTPTRRVFKRTASKLQDVCNSSDTEDPWTPPRKRFRFSSVDDHFGSPGKGTVVTSSPATGSPSKSRKSPHPGCTLETVV